jgi:hypothetical protein
MKRTPLRLKIPEDMRDELSDDPFMQVCILAHLNLGCEGKIEWQDAFTYAGKRQNVIWGILPMCHVHHLRESKYRQEQEGAMRLRIDHFRAEEQVAILYPKSTLLV